MGFHLLAIRYLRLPTSISSRIRHIVGQALRLPGEDGAPKRLLQSAPPRRFLARKLADFLQFEKSPQTVQERVSIFAFFSRGLGVGNGLFQQTFGFHFSFGEQLAEPFQTIRRSPE